MKGTVLACLVLFGCGPGAALEVVVEAPFNTPSECDGLTVDATRGGTALYHGDFQLTSHTPFPITQVLTTEDSANWGSAPVQVSVKALLSGELIAPGAAGSAEVKLQHGKVIRADVKLCDCTP